MNIKYYNEQELWDDFNKDMNNLAELYHPFIEQYKNFYINKFGISNHLHDDVYDVCLSSLYKAVRNFDTTKDNLFETYYSKKTNGYILNLLKKQKTKPILLDDNSELDIEDENIDVNFNVETISELKQHLSDDEYKIIELYYVKNYTNEEIGKLLGIKEFTARARHQEILHKLKRKMK